MKAALLFILLLTLTGSASAAIGLVGTPTITDTFTSSTTIAYPTGHASGHVGECLVVASSGATVTFSGWTQLHSVLIGTGWNGYLYERLLDGTEGSTATVSVSSGDVVLLNMRLYSGVNTTTPRDSAAANPLFTTGSTGQPTTAGFTTSQSGDMLIFFAYDLNAATAYTTPSGWGNASLDSGSANQEGSGSWDKAQATAGAIGTVATTGGTAGDPWLSIMVALQPPASVTGATASVTFQ